MSHDTNGSQPNPATVRLSTTQLAALRAAKAGALRWSDSLVTYVASIGFGGGINYRTGERLLALKLIRPGEALGRGDRQYDITDAGEVALKAHRDRELARAERAAKAVAR